MKKTVVKFLIVFMVLILIGACAGYIFIRNHHDSTIGKDAALQIALDAAGLEKGQVYDVDVEYEKERGNAYYVVDFDGPNGEYEYVISAATGKILTARPAA